MIMRYLFKVPSKVSSYVYNKINPQKYAFRIGVRCNPNKIRIYGKVKWGTEPWIIRLGDNVHITDGVQFITHDGGTLLFRDKIPTLEITKPISIGNNVYIGVQSIILPGVKIGNNVIIGAGSIVTKDIGDNVVVAGNPARVIKPISDYLDKIRKESLELGHLKSKEKDIALREYFNVPQKRRYTWKD